MALAFATILTCALPARFATTPRQVGFFLCAFSGAIVIVTTLLRREPTGPCFACLGDWGLVRVLAGRINLEAWLNVALFVPPAFFATLLWRSPWRMVLVASLSSLAIELAQPMVGVGVNDLMDLITNTAGAALGAAAGAVTLLVADTVRERRFDWARAGRVGLSLALGVAIVVGVVVGIGISRQRTATDRLQHHFAGTTLRDYETHRTEWDQKLAAVRRGSDRPTMTRLDYDAATQVWFTWNIYSTIRCVAAEWTPTGFDTISLSGAACIDHGQVPS